MPSYHLLFLKYTIFVPSYFVVLEKAHTSQLHLHLEMKQISSYPFYLIFRTFCNRRTHRTPTIIENNHTLFPLRDSVICFHTEPFASSPPSIRSNARRACIATSNSGSSCALLMLELHFHLRVQIRT